MSIFLNKQGRKALLLLVCLILTISIKNMAHKLRAYYSCYYRPPANSRVVAFFILLTSTWSSVSKRMLVCNTKWNAFVKFLRSAILSMHLFTRKMLYVKSYPLATLLTNSILALLWYNIKSVHQIFIKAFRYSKTLMAPRYMYNYFNNIDIFDNECLKSHKLSSIFNKN